MARNFAVVKMDQLGKLAGGAGVGLSLDDAVIAATLQTSGDKEPRYVVQVLRLVEVDPKPNVIVRDLAEVSDA